MATNTIIIDYGSGNLRSVAKAFEHVSSGSVKVTSNANDLASATHIVLPGVGAFGDCITGLSTIPGMIDALSAEVLEKKKPFLGICVGMQMLAEFGHEYGKHKGLGWIKGEVKRIETAQELPIPHMGWNELEFKRPLKLTEGMGKDVYFVHSYCFNAANQTDVIATTNYGTEITAIIARDNIMGVQFHPEKSQNAGLVLLRNFLTI